MEDEKLTPTPENPTPAPQPNPAPQRTPLDIIKDLRENSVPRADYQKLQDDYTMLLQAYAEGERSPAEQPQQEAEQPTLQNMRDALANSPDALNLEWIQGVMLLRKKAMEDGYPDPFLPQGNNISPTPEDISAAQRVADCLETCIEESQGDSGVFTALLQKYIVDVPLLHRGANINKR